MTSLVVSIILLAVLILVLIILFKKFLFPGIDVISSGEREKVLANISVLMAAGLLGLPIAALIELSGLPTSPLSIQLIVVVLEFIVILILVGAPLSFFVFKWLKWVFNVKPEK